MKTLIRCLMILHLLLAVVALTLGILIFQKREILIGRTQKLESALTAVAATVERADEVTSQDALPYEDRDIDSVGEHLIEEPARSDFWTSYRRDLEEVGYATIDLSTQREQLAQYYCIDPITLKPIRDPITRDKLTDGKGTMQELLDTVVERSVDQLNRLNNTRSSLRSLREELVATIDDVNARRQELRLAYHTIMERDGTVAALRHTIDDKDFAISQRDSAISSLERDIVDLNGEISRKGDEIAMRDADIEKLEYQLEIAFAGNKPINPGDWQAFTHGLQGVVAAINEEWNFVILKLSPTFMTQYNKMIEMGKTSPQPDLLVVRNVHDRGTFITKLKLSWVNREESLGVANILTGWKQDVVQIGDQILY